MVNHRPLRLILCGDVMTGRGIDQILAHPSSPELFEPYVQDARDYLALAEQVHGRIPRHVPPEYVWGEALAARGDFAPDLTVINLETAVTTSNEAWPGKGIHYRMGPKNVDVLMALGVKACVLANNHSLDWGDAGLRETLEVLQRAGLSTIGAGRNVLEAGQPAIFHLHDGGRVLVFAYAHPSSGVPLEWSPGADTAGVQLLPDISAASLAHVRAAVAGRKRAGDIVVCSLHWGSNWGYEIADDQRAFAHALIDDAAVDVVYGHSSHHLKGIEVYRGKLILYGCGDFLNDYEGIGGYESYRADLAVMYATEVDPLNGRVLGLTLILFQIRQFRLHSAAAADAEWVRKTLNREGADLNTEFRRQADNAIRLRLV